MMLKRFRILGYAALLAAACVAQAQPISVAAGAKNGTYMAMATELGAACPNMIAPRETTGSVQNLELLRGNKINAAFMQSDLLFEAKETDPASVANIKTIVGLHPEELHFIARADVKKEGGYGFRNFKIGGTEVVFNNLADLRGRVVGAVGGSVRTGRIVSQFAGLNYKVAEFPNNDALKKALLEGQVDTILVVGGAPHPMVKELDLRYRILPVDPNTTKVLSGVYDATRVSYTNMGAAGVPTVSTQALLTSRTYTSPEMIGKLRALRECFSNKLAMIKDTTDTHPKWQDIKAGDSGKWQVYDLK